MPFRCRALRCAAWKQARDHFAPFLRQDVVGAAGRTEIHDLECHRAALKRPAQCAQVWDLRAIRTDDHDVREQSQERLEGGKVERLCGFGRPIRDQPSGADDARSADFLPADVKFSTRIGANGQDLRIGVEYQAHARYDTTVSQLILVLSDLYPAALSDAARDSLPRLPLLEQWLARGAKHPMEHGWRDWLQRHSDDPTVQRAPPAVIAAAAAPQAAGAGSVWLATPVHLVAGLDTVRVHPAGVLTLESEEQQGLAHDFARTFAGSGYALHATGRRELLLSGAPMPMVGTLTSHDPAAWAGRDPRHGLVAGESAGELRRLGAEVEMWLYEHPINLARQARGLLSVSGLWLWGGGTAPMVRVASVLPEGKPPAVAWANDLFMDGLAIVSGLTLQPLPPRWPPADWQRQSGASEWLAVCSLGTDPGGAALERLEREWIGPAFEQWRSGEIARATLLAGDVAVTLKAAPLRRWWPALRRKPHPWWESWPAC